VDERAVSGDERGEEGPGRDANGGVAE